MKHASAFLDLVNDAMARIREVRPEEVAAMQKRGDAFRLIDVREDSEWAAGHIEGAAHLGKGIIERDIESVIAERSTKLVLYCGGGYRSALAADALQKMGYTNVLSLAEGWRGWCERNFPRT